MSENHLPPTLTLADLRPGQTGIVTELHGEGLERRRLMDLGIVPGTLIVSEMNSPLGDPVAYRIRGAVVALRQEQAQQILIRKESHKGNSTS